MVLANEKLISCLGPLCTIVKDHEYENFESLPNTFKDHHMEILKTFMCGPRL
jgi:hypothetical protein